MNRDELRDRAPEIPPAIRRLGEGAFWAGPLDGDRRGAWIGAGDNGMAACLLNRYPENAPVGAASRGEIIPHLLGAGNFHDGVDWLNRVFDPHRYSPFTLILTSLCGSAAAFAWDGGGALRKLRGFGDGWAVLTSSSWREDEVAPFRRRAFRDWLRSGAPLRRGFPVFHLLSVPGKEAWSPLMSRRNAETRSITQIEFDARSNGLTMRYWPRPLSPSSAPSCLTMPLNLPSGSRARDPVSK